MTDSPSGKAGYIHLFAIIFITTLFFAYSFTIFLSAGRDDTFIMLWAGQTFSIARGFVNYNLIPEEIASSELATWLVAFTSGWEPGHALLYTKILGLLAASLTLVVLWIHREKLNSSKASSALCYLPIVATLASQSFQYWSLGGLETPYQTFLLTIFAFSLSSCLQEGRHCGTGSGIKLVAVLSLLMLTRTEAFWPWLLTLSFILMNANAIARSKPAYAISVVPGVVFGLILSMRHYYTGRPWPNPVYAKVGVDIDTLKTGLDYIGNYLSASPWCMIQAAGFLFGFFACVSFVSSSLIKRQGKPDISAVLGSIVTCQIAFVILTGGNWMEYSRFIVPIIPTLNVLVLLAILKLGNHLRRSPQFVTTTSVLLSITCLTQIATWKNIDIKNCASPLSLHQLSSLELLSRHTIAGNCAHGRDLANLKPFIDQELPLIRQAHPSPLIVASYQAGFFPYFIRQRFTPEEVLFIDTVGLTDGVTAQLPGKRTARGLTAGGRIDLALRGESGALSEYLQTRPPALVYVLDADTDMRRNFAGLGYRIVLDKPGAVVFHKPEHGG